ACLDPARGLVAVDAGELDVHEDQVRPFRPGQRHRVLAGPGLDDLERVGGQQVAEDAPVVLLVVDDEDARAHARAPGRRSATGRSTWMGTVNENVEPSPSVDSTQRRPPCISTIRREMARPSPVPPLALARMVSACRNSSKIFSRSASAIPGPVSVTE